MATVERDAYEVLEQALDQACKDIKGDCPRVIKDIDPWRLSDTTMRCDVHCERIGKETWKCWKAYYKAF